MLSDPWAPHIMLSASCLVCLLASVACVLSDQEDGQPRVGWAVTLWPGTSCVIWPVFASRYYSINSAGASTLTFNATSIQNGVLLGFLLLVLGVLILPLFGVNLLASDEVSIKRNLWILVIKNSPHFSTHPPVQTARLMARPTPTLPRGPASRTWWGPSCPPSTRARSATMTRRKTNFHESHCEK